MLDYRVVHRAKTLDMLSPRSNGFSVAKLSGETHQKYQNVCGCGEKQRKEGVDESPRGQFKHFKLHDLHC